MWHLLWLLRWFCHVDDDNYVNPEALLALLSAFPQDADIYVGKPSLDKPITAHELLEGNATVRLPECLQIQRKDRLEGGGAPRGIKGTEL